MGCTKRDQMWLKVLSSFPAFSWCPPKLKNSKYFSRYGRSKLDGFISGIRFWRSIFWPFTKGKGQKSDQVEKNKKIFFFRRFPKHLQMCLYASPGVPWWVCALRNEKIRIFEEVMAIFSEKNGLIWPWKVQKNHKILALRNKNQKLWPPHISVGKIQIRTENTCKMLFRSSWIRCAS